MNNCFKIVMLLHMLVYVTACNNTRKEQPSGVPNAEPVDKVEQKPMPNPYANAEIAVSVYENDGSNATVKGSWGYDIAVNGALMVHQPNIPAAPGAAGFSTKNKAELAGKFVADKVRRNEVPPTVSLAELDSIKVLN